MRPFRFAMLVVGLAVCIGSSYADDALHLYEGDILPYDASAGWQVFDLCEPPCSESLEDGHFLLSFPSGGDRANYHRWIASAFEPAPETLWVEWQFRSNHPIGPNYFGCDGQLSIRYKHVIDIINMYGDAAISESGADFILGLDLDQLRTYRFESLNGQDYRVAVDGVVFMDRAADLPLGAHYIQLRGRGGCDGFPNTINEWDYVRYGTIDYGEQIISADPPAGMLNNILYPSLDRFTVTFDSPNYVFVDEITVSVTGGIAPVVTQTRRQDNGPPETVEIVLDRAIALGQTTTFTFNDGTAVNVIEYELFSGTPSDIDGDGVDDLLDNCPSHANPNQDDCDDDGTGDVCTIAECATGNTTCADCDSNNLPDGCQPDTDGDGVIDACDPCPNEAGNDGDSDGDTIPDCNDQCPGQDDLLDNDGNNIPDCLEEIIIPTVSVWGLILLSVGLIIASRRCFRRQVE